MIGLRRSGPARNGLVGRSRSETPDDLDLTDVQGGVLHGYRCETTSYLFLSIVDPTPAKLWLAELAAVDRPSLTTAALQHTRGKRWFDDRPSATAVNLAVSWNGLRQLGLSPARLHRLPEAFRLGMPGRADVLGDHPQTWDEPFTSGAVHLLLTVAGGTTAVQRRVEGLRQGFWQAGITELPGHLLGQRLPDGAEHFGFRDGLSQPQVLPTASATRSGSPLPAGEFIIGQPNWDGHRVDDVASVTRNGSYLVLRKLAQDVPGFTELITAAAEQSGLPPTAVAAKLMGRWPDGSPVTAAPELAEEPPGTEGVEASNGFDYADDPHGARCPIGAHIRRANPRGSLAFDAALEHRHRIIRRGMPYGPLYSPENASQPRGLVFVCFQADIAAQFEFVQTQWLGDGNVFALGTDRDPFAGTPDGPTAQPTRVQFEGRRDPDGTEPPTRLELMSSCVRVRGGEYFLLPGLRALRNLAQLHPTGEPRPTR